MDGQTYTMMNGIFINSCNLTLLDPGGNGNYSPNLDVTQVVCPSIGSCLELVFTSVDMETNVDRLTIYSGIDTTGLLLATITGDAFNDTIRSTTFEDGCLALNFKSNLFIQQSGFRAEISCDSCRLNPDLISLGEVGSSIITCNTTVLQPGAAVLESIGNRVTQTFCSGNDSCLKFAMRNSSLSTWCEFVRVYAGTDVNGLLLFTFSGFTSENLSGLNFRLSGNPCITIEYERLDSLCQGNFEMNLECTSCASLANSMPKQCGDQIPICELSEDVEFPLHTNNNNPFMNSIGCLQISPNPSWFYLHPGTDSPIDMQLNANSDIDFVCWGPFSESQYEQGVCELILNPEWANSEENIIDCSFSSSSSENVFIPVVLADAYYVLLVTNFSNEVDTMHVTFNDTISGLACTPSCSGVLTVEISNCDSLTNTYSLNGTFALNNLEIDGIITMETAFGISTEFTAPFDSLISFNFSNLPANGEFNSLSIRHNAAYSCGSYFTYNAPAACSACPVNIEEFGVVCEGDSLILHSTGIDLDQFTWSGPNGFESNLQTLHFESITSEQGGLYEVVASDSESGCSSRSSVFVSVQSLPLPTITMNAPYCGTDTLVLSAEFFQGYQVRWRGPNNYFHEGNTAVISYADELMSGNYSFLLTNGFCYRRVDSIQVMIYPLAETPLLNLTSQNDSIVVTPSFSEYSWIINGELAPEFNSQIIPITSTSYYQVICLNEFGCSSTSDAAFFVGNPNEITEQSIQLFPNPAQSMVYYTNARIGNWQLMDLTGRSLSQGVISSESGIISTTEFSSGMYYFRFSSKEGQTTIPLVVQH